MAKKPDKEGKSKGGRPTTYTEEWASLICQRLAEGESLRAICRDETTPAMSTVFKWLTQQTSFAEQYAHAREEQAEAMADEIVGIADGSASEDSAVLTARDRLRVDARKWVASKLKPKKYGDKVQQEISGPDGSAVKFENVSDEELKRRLAEKVAALGLKGA